MKTIPLKNNNGIIFNLNIPEDYVKIPLPYFKEWTEALDSGEYSQTQSRLCWIRDSVKSYCCLGVLSKVQNRLSADVSDGINGSFCYLSNDNPNYSFLSSCGNFPNGITVTPTESTLDAFKSLVDLNDNGLPFSEISKVIKEIWKEESLDNMQ